MCTFRASKPQTWAHLLVPGLVSLLVLTSVWSAVAQAQCNGTPTVEKYIYPPSAESGDPVSVVITVTGCSGTVDEPIPFDGALLIDMSGSMGPAWPRSDPADKRLDAAKFFVDSAALGTRLAIVTFSNEAKLVQALTDDKGLLNAKIDTLYGKSSGETNIYDAMDVAHELFHTYGSPEREKFIVLLTDGDDTSGRTFTDFEALANEAVDHAYRYLTIGLGSLADEFFLNWLSDKTNGKYCSSTTASDLADRFSILNDYASHQAKTREIVLEEVLSSQVQLIPGSIESDIKAFDLDLIVDFEEDGEVAIPIGALASGEGRFISFDVFSNCLTPDSPVESVEVNVEAMYSEGVPVSRVTYIFGVDPGEVPVPLRTFRCTRPGDIRYWKEFDFAQSILTIGLESRYLEGTIRDVRVMEVPSYHFQPTLALASPELAFAFPGMTQDVVVWEMAELAPREIKVMTIPLTSRVCSESIRYRPPVSVNSQKGTGGLGPGWIEYVCPDGEAKIVQMPLENASLLNVENCAGRPDLYIEPAFTFEEFWAVFQPQVEEVEPRSVLPKDRSESIWVDCDRPNGWWDGSSSNVGDYIDGAYLLPGGPGSSVEDRIRVRGQGDLFFVPMLSMGPKNAVFARVENCGEIVADFLADGVRVYAHNPDTGGWDVLTVQETKLLGGNGDVLVRSVIDPLSVEPAQTRPYAVHVQDALEYIGKLDAALAQRFRTLASEHPSLWSHLMSQPAVVPNDVLIALWDAGVLYDEFDAFLNSYRGIMAWGKPSVTIKVELRPVSQEKHTNNNSAAAVFLIQR